jgi:hypothetical protein
LTSSRPTTFDLAGRRASLGLAAYLGHGVKMPRLRFYNQRSRHEHSLSTPPLETATRAPWVTPPASSFHPGRRHLSATSARTFARQIEHATGRRCRRLRPCLDAGPPRGHPASSGSMLDGTPAGFGPIDAALRSSSRRAPGRDASRGRELRRFFGSPDLCRSISSDTPLRAPGPDPGERNHSRPPDRGRPQGTSMPCGAPSIEVPSIVRDRSGRPFESPSQRAVPAGRPARLPRVFTGVRDTG